MRTMNTLMQLVILSILTNLTVNLQAQGPPPLQSPEVHEDGRVTFRIRAPEADTVLVTGSWMNFGESTALVKGDSGVWEVTTGPLAPELYAYSFMVDGVKTLDPANKIVDRDGTWSVNNRLYIPGPEAALYEPKHGPKGTVHQVWYESPTLGMTRRMFVYTPPGYESSEESYPVLYLLHGGGGDEEAWPTLGVAPTIMDNLINAGKAKPMIVVMTNGNPGQAAAYPASPKMDQNSQAGGMANMMFEKSIVNDVIPWVESHLRAKTGAENRAITGLSMGGLQTINTSLNYPDMFDYYGVMSMGFPDMSRFGIEVDEEKRSQQLQTLKEKDPELYWIAIGKDDFLYESVVTMRNRLDNLDFDYVYRESEGGHTWPVWRIYLSEFAPMLFR